MIKMIAHIISSSVLIIAIWLVSFLMEKKMNQVCFMVVGGDQVIGSSAGL